MGGFESFQVTLVCCGTERTVDVFDPSDTFHCRKCGERMFDVAKDDGNDE